MKSEAGCAYISSGSGTKQTRLLSGTAADGFSTGYGRTASVTGGGSGGPLGPTPSPSSTYPCTQNNQCIYSVRCSI